jgi:Protein of unknown function (DUF669)
MTTVNFSELYAKAGGAATSTNYEPLPDGDYELKVIESSATTTSTGKLMFKVTTEVQGGAFDRRRVWDQLVITPENPKAMNMFFMKANSILGVGQDFWNANPSPAQIEQALLGRSFRATLGTRTYNGNKSNEIKRYYPAAAAASPVAAAPVAAAPAPSPAAAPAPAPAPASPVSTADTPF